MAPDADTTEQDAWEHGFVSVVSYLLRVERFALSDYFRHETKRHARDLSRWLVVVGVLMLLAWVGWSLALKAKPDLIIQTISPILYAFALIGIAGGAPWAYFSAKYWYEGRTFARAKSAGLNRIACGEAKRALPNPSEARSEFVFVSYTHDDLPKIAPSLHRIADSGCQIWYDRGIPGSSEWAALIEDKILRCRALIVFLSRDAVDSKWVGREIKFADHNNRPILGIRLQPNIQLQHGLSIVMEQYQMIDAWSESFPQELDRALKHLRLL